MLLFGQITRKSGRKVLNTATPCKNPGELSAIASSYP
jgi:hypothetical protein